MPINPQDLNNLYNQNALVPKQRLDSANLTRRMYSLPEMVNNYPGIDTVKSYTKYGVPIYPWVPLDDWRAKNQGRWQQFGNSVAQTGNELVLGTIKGITDIPKVARAYFSEDGMLALADAEAGHDAITDLYNSIKEGTPIYREQDETGFRPGKFAWWASGLPSVATTAAMLLPTIGAAKAVSWASKGLGAIAKTTAIKSSLKTIGLAEDALFLGKQGTALAATIGGAFYGNAYETYLDLAQQMPLLKQKLVDSGKFTPEQIDSELEKEGWNIYKGNVPNAALDMLGIYTLLKPFAGIDNILSAKTASRILSTTWKEALPEGIQEGVNYFMDQRAQANVDQFIGIRDKGDEYDLGELVNDGEAWTSMTLGALGGAVFMGVGNTAKQIGHNISSKDAGLFSGLGKALFSGITTPEAARIKSQQDTLSKLKDEASKLSSLKSFAEFAGNESLYKAVNSKLSLTSAILHMSDGTYGKYKQHLSTVGQVLDGLQQAENAKETPDNDILNEISGLKDTFQQVMKDTEAGARYYSKGLGFYGLNNLSPELIQYTNASVELDKSTKRINEMIGNKAKLFTEDDHGIYRTKRSKEVNDLIQYREELASKLMETPEGPEYGLAKKYIRDRIKQVRDTVNNLKGKDLDIDSQLELQIAEESIRNAEYKLQALESVDGTYTKRIKEIEALAKKDPSYANFVHGDTGIISTLDSEVANDSISDIRYRAVNEQIKQNNNINIQETINNLVSHKTTLTPENKAKLTSMLDQEMADVESTRQSAYLTELDNNPDNPEYQGIDRTDPEIETQLMQTMSGVEAMSRIDSEIKNKISAIQRLKDTIAGFPAYKETYRSEEQIVNDYINSVLTSINTSLDDIIASEDLVDDTVGAFISYLENLSKFIDSPIKYTVDKSFSEKISTLLDKAKETALSIAEKQKDQDLQQVKKYNSFIDSLVKSINAIIPDFEGKTLKDLQDAIKTIKDNKAKTEQLKALIDNTIASIKFTVDRKVYSKDAMKVSPEATIFTFASENGMLTPEYRETLNPKDLNVPEDKKETLDRLISLVDMVKLNRIVTNSISFESILKAENVIKDKILSLFPEQRVALYEFLIAYGAGNTVFYLQGVAGTGKTEVMAKAIIESLVELGKVKREEILSMAKGAAVNNKLSKSITGKEDNTIWFENQTLDKVKFIEAVKGKKFIILDEVGKLAGKEYKELFDVIDEVNKDREKGSKVRILLTGDPNQITNTENIAALDAYDHPQYSRSWKTIFISPLTISQRSNNGRVISFQKKFLNAGDNNVFDQPFTESHNRSHTQGVAITTGQADFLSILKAKVDNGADVALIVESKDQALFYTQKVPGLRVFTVAESQGLDFSDVFIDIKTYSPFYSLRYSRDNKVFYTAISRAKNYVNLLLPTTNGISEIDLPEDIASKELLQSKLDNNKADYIKHITSELKEFGVKSEEELKKTEEKKETVNPPAESVEKNTKSWDGDKAPVVEKPLVSTTKVEPVISNNNINSHYEGVKLVQPGTQVIKFRRESRVEGVDEIVYAVDNGKGLYIEVGNKQVPKTDEIAAPYENAYTKDKINSLVAKGMTLGTAVVSKAAPLRYSYKEEGDPVDQSFMSKIKAMFSKFFSTENYILNSDSVKTHIFVATDSNVRIENEFLQKEKAGITLYNRKDPNAKGAFGVMPGATYMRVLATGTHAKNNSVKTSVQYIPLEAKRLTKADPNLQEISKFIIAIDKFENLLSSIGVDYKYGKNDVRTVTIRGKQYELSSFELFLDALKLSNSTGDNVTTYSNIEEIKQLYERINASESKNGFIDTIKNINNLLYTVKNEKSEISLENPEMVEEAVNEFVALEGTGVEVLDLERSRLDKDLFDSATAAGFKVVVRGTSWDKPVELRRTFEISGTNSGKPVVYHVKVSIPLTEDAGSYRLEDKVIPRIEIFKIDYNKYKKFLENPTDPLSKLGAVERIRKGYKESAPEDVNVIYNNAKSAGLYFNFSGNNGLNTEELNNTILEFVKDGFPVKEAGPAQHALDVIAKNNNRVYIDDRGTFYSTQRNHVYHNKKGQVIKSVTSLSLTGAKTDGNNIYRADDIINPENNTVVTKYWVKVGDNFLDQEHGDQFDVRDLLERLLSFDDSGVSNVNAGFGLRETTFDRQTDLTNKDDSVLTEEQKQIKTQALSKLESHFNEIYPTFVEFEDERTNENIDAEEDGTGETVGGGEETNQGDSKFNQVIDSIKEKAASSPLEALTKLYTIATVFTTDEQQAIINKLIGELTSSEDVNPLADFSEEDVKELQKTSGIPKGNPLSKPEIISLLKKLIPGITEDEISIMANTITIDGREFSNSLGAVYKGIIYLLLGDNNTVDEQVVRHEAFHKILEQYVPFSTRSKIIDSARRTQGFKDYMLSRNRTVSTDAMVEEYLALTFQKYRLGRVNPNKNLLTKFFHVIEKIMIAIRNLFNRDQRIVEQAFNDITYNKYTEKIIPNIDGKSNFIKVVEKFFPENSLLQSLNSYVQAIDIIKEYMTKYRKNENPITYNNEFGVYTNFMSEEVEANFQIINAIKSELISSLLKLGYNQDTLKALSSLKNSARAIEVGRVRDKDSRAAILVHLSNPETVKTIIKELEGENAERYLQSVLEELRNSDYDLSDTNESEFTEYISNGGLRDEITQNINVNNEILLTKQVKEALTLVKGDRGYLTFRYVYARLLDLFVNDIDINGDILSQITKLKKSYKDYKTQVVLNFLQSVYTKAKNKNFEYGGKRITIPAEFSYFNNTFKYKGLEVKRSGTAQEFYDKVIDALEKYDDADLNEFISKYKLDKLAIYNLLKTIEITGFNNDLIVRILHKIGSQAQNDPIVDKVEFVDRWVGYSEAERERIRKTTLRASKISPSGIRSNIKSTILLGLQEFLIRGNKNNNLAAIKDSVSRGNLDYILTALGLPKYVASAIKETDQPEVRNKLIELINKIPVVSETFDQALQDYADANNATLSDVAKTLSRSSDFLTALNYLDSRNNSRYIFVTGSWIYDILKGLEKGKLFDFLTNDNHISRHNIFNPSRKIDIQKIYDTVSIDGISKTINNEPDQYPSIKYQNFTPADFYQHRFLHGFLSQVILSEKEPRYYQYTYIQSDRKTDVAAKIKLLNSKTLELAFNELVAYERDRQEVIRSGKFRIKNFNKSNKPAWFTNLTYQEFSNRMMSKSAESFRDFIEEFDPDNQYHIKPELLKRQLDSAMLAFENQGLISKGISKQLDTMSEAIIKDYLDEATPRNVTAAYKDLYVAYHIFYVQNYINGEFLNQLVFGDKAFTKNIEDLTKRMQGVQSPGDAQVISENGQRRFSKAVNVEDVKRPVGDPEDTKSILQKIYSSKGYEITDAYTLGTPTTLKYIHKGTGNYHLKGQIKPVGFWIDKNGVTHYVKTALFIIDNELAAFFPSLKEIRRQMETHGLTEEQVKRHSELYNKVLNGTATPKETYEYESIIDNGVEYYTFSSAYKVGAPLDSIKNGEPIRDENIVQFDNKYIRIQADPLSDSADMSNTTQFNYFTNSNGLNESEAFTLYSIDAKLMKLGFDITNAEHNFIDEDGGVNKAAVTRAILKSLSKSPQDERLFDLIYNHIDINFPSIVGRAAIAIASKLSKDTIEIRHAGQKLVAQSSFGVKIYQVGDSVFTYNQLVASDKAKADNFNQLTYNTQEALTSIADILSSDRTVLNGEKVSKNAYISNYRDYFANKFKLTEDEKAVYNTIVDSILSDNNNETLIPRRLKIRDNQNYTEVIAPAWWAKHLKVDPSSPIYAKYNTGMAVRIPTTGIHSSVPIKIIFTSDPTINRIIAPEELIALHGSDFDVDSLFVMHREVLDSSDLKNFGKDAKSITIGDHTFSKGSLIGYDERGKLIPGFEKSLLDQIENAKEKKGLRVIYDKYLKNLKVENNLNLITADKNQSDMNTPISFAPFKLDPFAKITLSDYYDWLTKNYGKTVTDFLKETLESNLSDLPDEVSSIFKSINLGDVIDIDEFLSGRLVVSDSLLQTILKSDVGVETKLKLLYKKQDLKQGRDINDLTSQMRIHQDNLGGKMGVGIHANTMKVMSYLMYGGKFILNGKDIPLRNIVDIEELKDGRFTLTYRQLGTNDIVEETGELKRPPVKLRKVVTIREDGEKFYDYQPLSFRYNGKNYDSLSRETKTKNHKVFELLDTIINGYIDNVKEQVTSVINANTITIDIISLLVGIGMEFDSVVYIMNQPVIKTVTKSRIKYKNNKDNSRLKLEEALAKVNPGALEAYKNDNSPLEFGDSYTSDILKKYGNRSLESILPELTSDEILTQLHALDFISQGKSVTSSFFRINKTIQLFRSFPVRPEQMKKTEEDIQFIRDGRLPFDSENILAIPHIAEAVNQFETMYDIVKNVIPLSNDYIQEAIATVQKRTNYSLKSKVTDITLPETLNQLTKEFQSFLMSYVIENAKVKGMFDSIKDYNAVDLLSGELVKEVTEANASKKTYTFTKNKRTISRTSSEVLVMSPEELWIQKFLLELKDLKADLNSPLNGNTFLDMIVVSRRKGTDSRLGLTFTKGTGSDVNMDGALRSGFLNLPKSLQEKFTLYAVMHDGAGFGFRTFTNFIPAVQDTDDLTLSNISTISRLYIDDIVNRLLIPKEDPQEEKERVDKLNNLLEYFEFELIRTNSQYIKNPFYKSKKSKLQVNTVVDNSDIILKSIGIDPAFKNSYVVIAGKMLAPRWWNNRGNIYLLVNTYTSNDVVNYIYKKIGTADIDGMYRYNSFYEDNSIIKQFEELSAVAGISPNNLGILKSTGKYSFENEFSSDEPITTYSNKRISLENTDGTFTEAYVSREVEIVDESTKEVTKVERDDDGNEITVAHPTKFYKVKVKMTYSLKPVPSQENSKTSSLTDNQIEVVKNLAARLSKRFGVKHELVYSEESRAGWVENGVVYINLTRVKADTPIHEFGHIYIHALKKENPELYEQIKYELLSSKEGSAILREVRGKRLYEGLTNDAQIEEAIVEMLGREGARIIDSNTTLKGLVKKVLDWIGKVLKQLIGIRVDRYDTITNVAKYLALGKDAFDLSQVAPEVSASQSSEDTLFSDDMVTNDESIQYSNGKKTTFRASFIESMFSPFKSLRKKPLSYEEKAERDFNARGLSKDDVWEEKLGNRVLSRITFEQYADKLRRDENRERFAGKAVHLYYQFLETGETKYLDMAQDYTSKAGMTNEDLAKYKPLFDETNRFIRKATTDKIFVERTITMDMPEFSETNEDGLEVKGSGISGTVDKLIDHGNNVFTLLDYKTGDLDVLGLKTNQIMRYSSKAKVKWRFDSYHRNVLKMALYTVLIRSKMPNAKFRDVVMMQTNLEVGRVDPYYVELEPALKILSEYFKETHKPFWNSNQDLFDFRTLKEGYFSKEVEKRKAEDSTITKEAVKLDIERQLLSRLRIVSASRGSYLYKKRDQMSDVEKKAVETLESEYQEIVGKLMELELGYDPIAGGTRQGIDIVSAATTNLLHRSNPLLEYFRKMFYHGQTKSTDEAYKLEREHKKYLIPLEKEFYAGNKKKVVGTNYEEFYSFLWDYDVDKGYNLVTFLSPKWKSLTKAQRDYADFYRIKSRYHLLLTMHPEEGIQFITKELEQRENNPDETLKLSEDFVKMLRDQLEILVKQPKWNKFLQSYYRNFKYYEGWTPRVTKTIEESKNLKEYWAHIVSKSFAPNEDDEIQLNDRGRKTLSLQGVAVRYLGMGEGSAVNHKQLYTFNAELTLAAFTANMLNKFYLDDVYNIGVGIDLFWKEQDEDDTSMNKGNILFLESFLKNIVLQQTTDDFQGRMVTIPGRNVKVKLETLVRYLRTAFAVPALALNVLGAASTGTSQMIKLMVQGMVGTVSAKIPGAREDMGFFDTVKSALPIASWAKATMFNFKNSNSLDNNKMHLFLQKFGFLPSSYENDPSAVRRLRTTQGWIFNKKLDNELLLSLYSKVDNAIYASYLYGQLQGIRTKDKNGKDISMWDAYEIVNGELTYTGGDRGVNKQTGEIIAGITTEEIIKMKAFSERDTGGYRKEEQNVLSASVLGAILMTFKRWIPAVVRRAFTPQFEDATLGKWINSGESPDPDFPNLPLMTWVREHNEGWVISLVKSIGILALFVKDQKRGGHEWNNLSPLQKQNVIYGISRLATFVALYAAISAMFGGVDDDDKNKITRTAARVVQDSGFEFVAPDIQGWKSTFTSFPAIEKPFTFSEGLINFTFNGLVPDLLPGREPLTVQSGKHEGWYKGSVDILRNVKFLSTGYGFWELGQDWEDLDDSIRRLQ